MTAGQSTYNAGSTFRKFFFVHIENLDKIHEELGPGLSGTTTGREEEAGLGGRRFYFLLSKLTVFVVVSRANFPYVVLLLDRMY